MSSSKSKSTTTTKTEQYDQRILAEHGATVIGTGATIDIYDEFGENVANAFTELIEFAGAAGREAIEQSEKTQETLASQLTQEQTPVISVLNKILPVVIIAVLSIRWLLLF